MPEIVIGDPTRLRQITVNLLGNAIKFTERGEVVLKVRVVDCPSSLADPTAIQTTGGQPLKIENPEVCVLHFLVRDTGIGIPREKQELIFHAFSQADGSTTRRFGGTGLGLTISSSLVQMMKGRMWVESEVGRGSTFHFTVQLGLAKKSIRTSEVEPVPLRDTTVLIVDDNATSRLLLMEMFTRWEMKPSLAEGGEAALAALHEARDSGRPFKLVLTDAHMPGMDGFNLAERIKQTPQLTGVVIMMLTSGGQRGEAARCRELGVAGYLTKPIRQCELREAVVGALSDRLQHAELPSLITRHSLREGRRGIYILLVEDNIVNRRLASRLLEKRGYRAIMASNGQEALAALEQRAVHVVLMDIQMPEMDGLQATAAIREKEKRTGNHVPIIAMTAHAMKGDQERCLAAGMDAYISKPICPHELFEAIERLVSKSRTGESIQELALAPVATLADSVTSREIGTSVKQQGKLADKLDRPYVLARVDGDVALLRELVELFVDEAPKLLSEIRDSIARCDPKALERTAHRLKGSVGNFCTQGAFEAALKLENLGQAGDLSHADAALDLLEEEIERLKPLLFTGFTKEVEW